MVNKNTKIDDAAQLFEEFTGDEADYVDSHTYEIPDVGMEIGEVDGILYTTKRDGVIEKYVHTFKKASRPLLAVSSDGKQLFMVGGSYQFTEKGIEDI